MNTHAAEANLHRFPLPQAPGWGAILQFLTSISKCKEARNFRLGIFRSVNKYRYAISRRQGSKSILPHANGARYLLVRLGLLVPETREHSDNFVSAFVPVPRFVPEYIPIEMSR